MDLHCPFIRASYTVTRDGTLKVLEQREESGRTGQKAPTTASHHVASTGHHPTQSITAHASRNGGGMKVTCDSTILPKPSQLKPRQQKRKRKLETPVVLDHLAQLRRKQQGFATGQFGDPGEFFGGPLTSQNCSRDEVEVQAVPCSPNLKKVRPPGGVYDLGDTSSGFTSQDHHVAETYPFNTPQVHIVRGREPVLSGPSEFPTLFNGLPQSNCPEIHQDPTTSGMGCSQYQTQYSYGDVQQDCTTSTTGYGDMFTAEPDSISQRYSDFMVPQSRQPGNTVLHNTSQIPWAENEGGVPTLSPEMGRQPLDPDLEETNFSLSESIFSTFRPTRGSCDNEEGPLIPWEE